MTTTPTTLDELSAAVIAQWPKVIMSSYAYERIAVPALEVATDGYDGDLIDCVHRYVSSGGLIWDGQTNDNPQLYFNETDAITALWYWYNKLTPAMDFDTDTTGKLFIWRSFPEMIARNGTFSAVMRYSGVYQQRDGSYAGIWEGK